MYTSSNYKGAEAHCWSELSTKQRSDDGDRTRSNEELEQIA